MYIVNDLGTLVVTVRKYFLVDDKNVVIILISNTVVTIG